MTLVETETWRDRAACKGMNPDLFFPENGQSPAAHMACAVCPVTAECLEYAIVSGETGGVWGGLCGKDRREYRRANRRQTFDIRICQVCEDTFTPNGPTNVCGERCRLKLRAAYARARRIKRLGL